MLKLKEIFNCILYKCKFYRYFNTRKRTSISSSIKNPYFDINYENAK